MEIIQDTEIISVLLIEDNPGDQILINENLREADFNNFSITNCSSLSEGIHTLATQNYDVVLLDLWLPDSEGLNTLREIIKHETSVPIIVLTIDKSDITGLKAIKFGAQDYLAKDELHQRNLCNSIRYAINRKKLELKLKESLSIYESTFERSAVGFAHLSPEGVLIKINKKFSEITGYTEKELLGKSIFDITFPGDVEQTRHNIEQLASGEISDYSFEKRFIRKDGSIIWANVTRSAIPGNQNEIKYFFTTIEDITQRKSLEAELHKQKDLLDNVINIMPVGVTIINGEGNIVSINKEFVEIWGGSIYQNMDDHKKFKGWWADSGKPLLPEDWASYRALNKKETTVGEIITIESFDGLRKTILNSAIPIIKDDKVIYIVVVIEEITQLLKTEEKLRESIAEKEILMKESNHRIKNNLQLISSFINLQLSNVADEKARSILADSINRIASISLLHDYLFRTAKLNRVNVQNYLFKIIDHIKSTLHPDSLNIKIVKDIDNFEINSGLAISLGLIVNEIITNSVKYAFKDKCGGLISLELKLNQENILFTLKDDGIGMGDNLDFENATTLGFQILYSLVTQHKGIIKYELDDGTKFIINIPLY